MTALWEYAKAACTLLPGPPGDEPLGRVVPLTGAAAQTITAGAALAFGGLSEQTYSQVWMWRPKAATANAVDNIRYSDSFTPSTGVVTHSGTAYTDTTSTDESAILSRFYPGDWRNAIDLAIRNTRELDYTNVPVRKGLSDYHLYDLTWIEEPSWIRKVWYTNSPVIVRNRFLQKWHSVNTSGAITPPDNWTVTGTGATCTRSTTTLWRDKYTTVLTRVSNDCRLGQTFPTLLRTGVLTDGIEGEDVVAWAVLNCGTASRSRVRIYENGSAVGSSDFHTGGSGWEELSKTVTVTSTAFLSSMEAAVTVETGDMALTIGEIGFAYGTAVTDAMRRDAYTRYPVHVKDYEFEQGGPLRVRLPNSGAPAQFVICSERPYPGFDATRLATGTADTDESDAPLQTVATGTIYYLLRGKLGERHPDTEVWRKKFDQMRASHLYMKSEEQGGGFNLMGGPITAGPGMVR